MTVNLLKRKVSILIPYCKKGNAVFVFLQKRSTDAVRLPGYYGFFGGGAEENENAEATLLREIKEEMDYSLTEYVYLNRYEFEKSDKSVFFLEVSDDFEKEIKIKEGAYGKYFSKDEVFNEPKLIEEDKIVLSDFFKKIDEVQEKDCI